MLKTRRSTQRAARALLPAAAIAIAGALNLHCGGDRNPAKGPAPTLAERPGEGPSESKAAGTPAPTLAERPGEGEGPSLPQPTVAPTLAERPGDDAVPRRPPSDTALATRPGERSQASTPPLSPRTDGSSDKPVLVKGPGEGEPLQSPPPPPPPPRAPKPSLAERPTAPIPTAPTSTRPEPRPAAPSGASLAERPNVAPVPPPPPPPAPSPALAERPGVALLNEADASLNRSDPARAEKLYRDALTLLERGPERDSLVAAAALSRLSQIYRDRAEFARAEPLAERALALREQILGKEHLDTAEAADNLAWLYWQRGDFRRAEPLAERAFEVRERAFNGKPNEHVAVSLTTLGVLLWEKGDYGRAEQLLLRARYVEETVHGSEHRDVAVALDNLGGLYWDKGDFARAEKLFARALAIREAAPRSKDPDIGVSITYLGIAALERDDFARTEQLFARAHAVWKAAYGEEHPRFAQSLANLGELYLAKGEHGRAEPLLLRALRIFEKVFGKEHPFIATCLDDLATLYRETGAFDRARPHAERSLALRRASYGDAHVDVAESRNHLARLALAEGNIEAATDERERAAAILDHTTALLLATGSEEQKRAYMDSLQKSTDETISLHARRGRSNPRAAALALTTILRRKGRVLDAMTDGFGALHRHLAPGDQALLDRLASVRSELGALALRGLGKMPLEQYRASTATLEEEQQRLEAQVSARSAEFRREQRPVTLEEVQAAIPEDAALIEIVIYAPFDERARTPATRRGEPRYAAYVLKQKGEPAFLDLGEAAPLDAAAAELRGALSDPTVDPKPSARALDARLMQPIRAVLDGTRRLLLSPDGVLNLIPFAALLDEHGQYLIERLTFTYLSSGRDLVWTRSPRGLRRALPAQARASRKPTAVVLANPAFGPLSAPVEASHRGGRRSIEMASVLFPPLPGTAAEGRAIGEKLAGVQLLTGAAATEGAVKALRGPSIVHIATHGFFLPSSEAPKGKTARGPERALAAPLSVAAPTVDNPLLRAGLAFAGANQRESGGDDGVLTALEASSLDLRGTELIVLSACETGVGEAQRGEGVYGLRRALSIAGAETQVMSLWKVDDDATRALMVAYYAGLTTGGGKSEAMHRAQLSLLSTKATAHPYYWASFVVSGDGSKLADAGADLPVLKVQPGPRGCSCAQVGQGGGVDPGLGLALAMALGGAAAARRRGDGGPRPPIPRPKGGSSSGG